MPPRIFDVPLKPLTPETAQGFGVVYTNFETAEVEQRPWPLSGKRPLNPGTGYGGIAERPFEVFWRGEVLFSRDLAMGEDSVHGWLKPPGEAREDVPVPAHRPHLLVATVNYHADGGQAFGPHNRVPVVYVVAPEGEDPQPEDFVALYSNGSKGLVLHPYVWHTPPLPLAPRELFDNKQGALYATVDCDFMQEQNLLLKVPLRAL